MAAENQFLRDSVLGLLGALSRVEVVMEPSSFLQAVSHVNLAEIRT
eukprot:gene41363-51218_t